MEETKPAKRTIRFAWTHDRMRLQRACYFQPDALSHAARSAGWVFSPCVIDRVSLLSILSFMQVQYLRMMSSLAPPLLSLMHWLIHLRSSAFCWPNAAVAAIIAPSASRTAVVRFIVVFLCRSDRGLNAKRPGT